MSALTYQRTAFPLSVSMSEFNSQMFKPLGPLMELF